MVTMRNRIVVTFRKWEPGRIPDVLSACGAEKYPDMIVHPHARTVVALVSKGSDPDAVLAALAARPEVEGARFDFALSHAVLYHANSNDARADELWHLKRMNIPRAHKYTRGAGAKVCIADTGYTLNGHVDLPTIAPGDGYNAVTSEWDPTETHSQDEENPDFPGHGTMVSGVVFAARNNSTGVVGVAPEATPQFIALGGWDPEGGVWNLVYSAVVASVYAAADMAAVAVNCSWYYMTGGGLFEDQMLRAAILYARANGCTTVVAAGNGAYNPRRMVDLGDPLSVGFAPANTPEAFTVGGIQANDAITRWQPQNNQTDGSNYGAIVDITAPAARVLTAAYDDLNHGIVSGSTPQSNYVVIAGTSFASPCVDGVFALVASANPALTREEREQIVRTHTDASFSDDYAAWFPNAGIANAAKPVLGALTFPGKAVSPGARYPLAQFFKAPPYTPPAAWAGWAPETIRVVGSPTAADWDGPWRLTTWSGGAWTTTLTGDVIIEARAYSDVPTSGVEVWLGDTKIYDGPDALLTATATYDAGTAQPFKIVAKGSPPSEEIYDDILVSTLAITATDPLGVVADTLAPVVAPITSPTADEPIVFSGSIPSYLAAEVICTATAVVNAQIGHALRAEVTGTASASANLTTRTPLAAAVACTATATADLTIGAGVQTSAPVVAAFASPTGAAVLVFTGTVPGAEVVHPLAAEVSCSASVSATLRAPTAHPLAVSVLCTAAATADLSHPQVHALAAEVAGTATVVARLIVSAWPLPPYHGPWRCRLTLSGPSVRLTLPGPTVRLYLDDKG